MNLLQQIVVIGTGNVAWQLCRTLLENGNDSIEVIGRNNATLFQFELEFNVKTTNISYEMNPNADLYILALPDDIIPIVAKNIPNDLTGLVVHTSGTGAMDLISMFTNYGVLYPLQTMVKGEEIDFKQVPLLLETNSNSSFRSLLQFAKTISDEVDEVSSSQRQKLHVAAVFANNFSNHMISIARDICEQENVSFNYLLPLLKETFSKIQNQDTREIQTGPAIRDDDSTINKHLAFLANQKDRQLLYQLITHSIQKMHQNKDNFEARP